VKIMNTVVAQSSDQSYHCLSMVLLCAAAALCNGPGRSRGRPSGSSSCRRSPGPHRGSR
jgi:hypothetical protein